MNKEKARERAKRWRDKNPEYSKLWYEAHREKRLAQTATYQRAHPEMNRESTRRWREKNPEKVLAAAKLRWAKDGAQLSAKAKVKREANVDAARAYISGYMKKYLEQPGSRLVAFLTHAKKRARARGLEFDESLRITLKVNPPTECRCCHATLDYSLQKGKNYALGPSLDRVDPSKGYTVENVAVLCLRCNKLKRDATLQEVEQIAAYMRSFQAQFAATT